MSSQPPETGYSRDIYSVSRLNSEVRAVLEGSFPLLWVEGEISNLARPSSGHIYFSLKDPHAQVRCAMFRMKRLRLRFEPENGQKVLIRARVGLYEGRGEFQLVAEHMEPAGEGALQQAFEELKRKLAAEGLFDTTRKRPLPPLPKRIGIITSPSGAAIRDVISVLGRRFPGIPVLVYPVSVQGESSAGEIIDAIGLANRRGDCDLLILTRGGGSLEDLISFNDEGVARAIYASAIPLISAVGHEIDFTIADFVADLRAPTPSVAAEIATPDREEWTQKVAALVSRLQLQIQQRLNQARQSAQGLERRLSRTHPETRLRQRAQRLDELERRLRLSIGNRIGRAGERLNRLGSLIRSQRPGHRLAEHRQRANSLGHRLGMAGRVQIKKRAELFFVQVGKLNTLNPLATLERGYSISREYETGGVLRDSSDIAPGERMETLLARGRIISRVESVEERPAPTEKNL
jgi:exodeoxyribonuclease VII large subunit